MAFDQLYEGTADANANAVPNFNSEKRKSDYETNSPSTLPRKNEANSTSMFGFKSKSKSQINSKLFVVSSINIFLICSFFLSFFFSCLYRVGGNSGNIVRPSLLFF
jgi:hypothetical protein